MARKRKGFSKVKAVKDAARVAVGEPKPSRAIPDTKKQQRGRGAKHRKSVAEAEWEQERE
jgi:hypothetical protein